MISLKKPLVLASGSLRRQRLLRDLGWAFEVRQSAVKEDLVPGKTPAENVMLLANKKVAAVAAELDQDAIIVGADTMVVLEGEIMNKPVDVADARRMLSGLSDHTHEVYTGFTLYDVES